LYQTFICAKNKMPTISDKTKSAIIYDVNKDLYYFYHNWPAGQNSKIHKGSCNHCKFGFGKKEEQTRGENGVWIGPFDSIELLNKYLFDYYPNILPPDYCKTCRPSASPIA